MKKMNTMKKMKRTKTSDLFRYFCLSFVILMMFGLSPHPAMADTGLSAPASVKAEATRDGIKVTWTKVAGAVEYKVSLYNFTGEPLSSYESAYAYDYAYVDDGNSYTFTWMGEGDYIVGVQAVDSDWYMTSYRFSKKVTFKYYDIYMKSVTQTSLSQIKVSWEQPYDACRYYVYRKVGNGSFKLVKTITEGGITNWTDTKIAAGKTYSYRVKYESYWGTNSEASDILSVTTKVKAPKLTAEAAGISSIKVSWGRYVKGVDGYEIYRSTSRNGRYTKVRSVRDTSVSSFADGKKALGKEYYYKARVYRFNGEGKKVYSNYSGIVHAHAAVTAPRLCSVKAKNGNSALVKWEKVPKASGYMVYYSTSLTGSYKKAKTVTGGSKLSVLIKKLQNGNTYYFKVRAYKKSGSKKYAGAYSNIRSRLVATFAYAGESYGSRTKRIFNKDSYVAYSSEKEAKSHMTSITVKVWDVNGAGNKYSKYITFSVHKNIAPTVKKIFSTIYNGKEKFPFHTVFGFSWRNSSSEHDEGLAIDMNPDENYFYDFVNKKILAGKLWKPGKNVYSIPENGDVEKAFNKYGFTRGRWSTRTDYMHFSYFGT